MIGLGRCDGVAFGAGRHRRRDSHAHSESWRFPRTKSRVRRRYPLRGRSRCDNSSHGDLPTVSPPEITLRSAKGRPRPPIGGCAVLPSRRRCATLCLSPSRNAFLLSKFSHNCCEKSGRRCCRCTPPPCEPVARAGLLWKRLRSSSPEISTAPICQQKPRRYLDVTPRYVHLLFDTEDLSFKKFVIERRQVCAYEMLLDSQRSDRTATAIAFTHRLQ